MTPLCHPEERKRRGVSIIGGGKKSLPQPIEGVIRIPLNTPPKRILSLFWGKGGDLRFAQDDTSCRFEGGLLTPSIQMRRFLHFVRNDTVGWFFCPFLGLVGKGCPLPIICHPEPSLRGVSSVNGGVKNPLLQLHPKT